MDINGNSLKKITMSKKYWIFCKSCGKAYQTLDLKTQFCTLKCMEIWINNENDIHNTIARNFGQKDSTKYNRWRCIVRKKFNYKCAICNERSISLHAHHVIPWSDNVELRYNTSNSLLVCELCHSIIHGYSIGCGTKILHNEKRIKEVRKKYIEITKIKYMKQGNL